MEYACSPKIIHDRLIGDSKLLQHHWSRFTADVTDPAICISIGAISGQGILYVR